MESANFIPLGSVKERLPFDQPEKPERPPKVFGTTRGDLTVLVLDPSQNTDHCNRGAQENCSGSAPCRTKGKEENQIRCQKAKKTECYFAQAHGQSWSCRIQIYSFSAMLTIFATDQKQ
jgi:hypothetical protein